MNLVSEEDIGSKMPCDKSGMDFVAKNYLAMHIAIGIAIYQKFLPANTVRQNISLNSRTDT